MIDKSTKKFPLAKYLLAFFLVVFLIVLVLKFSDLKEFVLILKNGIWYYLIIIFILQILYIISQSMVYLKLYPIFGRKGDLWETINIFLATNFINLSLPLSGITGVITFIGYGAKIGLSKTQALFINVLFYICVFLSFSFLTLSLIFFPKELKLLNSAEITTILVFIFVVVILTILFLLMIAYEKFFLNMINFAVNFTNKISQYILKRKIIFKEKLEQIISEASVFRLVVSKNKKIFALPLLYSFTGHLIHFLLLYFVFLAFGANVMPIIPLIGYIISVVFIIISVTPSGIGIVEPLMILYFTSSGVSLELATIVTLIFRGVVFWLPFFLGFFSIKKLQSVD